MERIHTYNIDINFNKPLKFGLIACITRRDLMDRRSIWSKIGFLSRLIPFSFDYDQQMKLNILDFINKNQRYKQNAIKIRRKRTQTITIPEDIYLLLKDDARRMAFEIEQFCLTPLKDRVFGARALNQISAYIKAIALGDGESVVNAPHYERFKHLYHYFNYGCPLILPRKGALEVVSSD